MSTKALAYARLQDAYLLIDHAQRTMRTVSEQLTPVKGCSELHNTAADARRDLLKLMDLINEKLAVDLANVDLDI